MFVYLSFQSFLETRATSLQTTSDCERSDCSAERPPVLSTCSATESSLRDFLDRDGGNRRGSSRTVIRDPVARLRVSDQLVQRAVRSGLNLRTRDCLVVRHIVSC